MTCPSCGLDRTGQEFTDVALITIRLMAADADDLYFPRRVCAPCFARTVGEQLDPSPDEEGEAVDRQRATS